MQGFEPSISKINFQNPQYRVKDLKKVAEDELRVKPSYSKCKRARILVLECKLDAREGLEEGIKVNEPRHQHHGTKLSKKGQLVTCSACKLKDHKKASCFKVSLQLNSYLHLFFSLNIALTCLLLCFRNKSSPTTTPLRHSLQVLK